MAKSAKGIKAKTHDRVFGKIHGGRLIYNTCWEDPRADRGMLKLDASSKVVMITSAGCNALDYLLDGPEVIHCVDVNPRQNALLELKRQLIRRGDFADLFKFFGKGHHKDAETIYGEIRPGLATYAREFWDKKLRYFSHPGVRGSFYYHGAAGSVAWVAMQLLKTKPKLRRRVHELLDAKTLEEQQAIYQKIEPDLWGWFMKWLVDNPLTMALLGVPRPQISLIQRSHPGGLLGYVKDKLEHVLTQVPIQDNYFWRVYLTGSYTRDCCPNYLKEENFDKLRMGLHKIQCHNDSVSAFLADNPGQYTHYVLLDHQDWLAYHDTMALREEWGRILENCVHGAKILARSAGTQLDFLPDAATAALRPLPEISAPFEAIDRVGTYGGLLLAEVL